MPTGKTQRRNSGQLLIATGLLHHAVGLYVYRGELAAMIHGGVIATVRDDRTAGAAAVWFFTTGFLMLLLGSVFRWVEVDLGRPLPARAGVGLLAIALFAGLLMPENGVWLFVPQGLLIIARARNQRASEPAGAVAH